MTRPLEGGRRANRRFYVNTECRPWLPRDHHPRRAGVSAFGFGGTNFHCVLEEHDRCKPGVDWDGNVQTSVLGGNHRQRRPTLLGTRPTVLLTAPGRRDELGFLFPGQGSQSVGMLRDLACTFPVMQEVLAEADRAFAAGLVVPGESRLSDFIYPQPAFTAESRASQEIALRATAIASPPSGPLASARCTSSPISA